ncbi:MAG: hypothetical protein L3J98_17260 [Gammaproteobacteria bacterium]|nr:hypothetical protein [Gammaproteobacteria bacterium]
MSLVCKTHPTFLHPIKNKHYRDKKDWAINFLKLEIRAMEQGLKALVKPDKELVMLIEQRKKWLTTLNENKKEKRVNYHIDD